jgi:glycosyltransferase A (GT-A) superfamily protein (DUF2064 family)
MDMPIEELKIRYKNMYPGQDRVKILADLNDVTADTIREVLGLPALRSKRTGEKAEKTNARWVEFERLYRQGKTDAEISREMQCNANNIYLWRREQNLPRNDKKQRRQQDGDKSKQQMG